MAFPLKCSSDLSEASVFDIIASAQVSSDDVAVVSRNSVWTRYQLLCAATYLSAVLASQLDFLRPYLEAPTAPPCGATSLVGQRPIIGSAAVFLDESPDALVLLLAVFRLRWPFVVVDASDAVVSHGNCAAALSDPAVATVCAIVPASAASSVPGAFILSSAAETNSSLPSPVLLPPLSTLVQQASVLRAPATLPPHSFTLNTLSERIRPSSDVPCRSASPAWSSAGGLSGVFPHPMSATGAAEQEVSRTSARPPSRMFASKGEDSHGADTAMGRGMCSGSPWADTAMDGFTAYLTATSGSSSAPRWVAVSCGSVKSFLLSHVGHMALSRDDVVAAGYRWGWSAQMLVVLSALVAGAAVALSGGGHVVELCAGSFFGSASRFLSRGSVPKHPPAGSDDSPLAAMVRRAQRQRAVIYVVAAAVSAILPLPLCVRAVVSTGEALSPLVAAQFLGAYSAHHFHTRVPGRPPAEPCDPPVDVREMAARPPSPSDDVVVCVICADKCRRSEGLGQTCHTSAPSASASEDAEVDCCARDGCVALWQWFGMEEALSVHLCRLSPCDSPRMLGPPHSESWYARANASARQPHHEDGDASLVPEYVRTAGTDIAAMAGEAGPGGQTDEGSCGPLAVALCGGLLCVGGRLVASGYVTSSAAGTSATSPAPARGTPEVWGGWFRSGDMVDAVVADHVAVSLSPHHACFRLPTPGGPGISPCLPTVWYRRASIRLRPAAPVLRLSEPDDVECPGLVAAVRAKAVVAHSLWSRVAALSGGATRSPAADAAASKPTAGGGVEMVYRAGGHVFAGRAASDVKVFGRRVSAAMVASVALDVMDRAGKASTSAACVTHCSGRVVVFVEACPDGHRPSGATSPCTHSSGGEAACPPVRWDASVSAAGQPGRYSSWTPAISRAVALAVGHSQPSAHSDIMPPPADPTPADSAPLVVVEVAQMPRLTSSGKIDLQSLRVTSLPSALARHRTGPDEGCADAIDPTRDGVVTAITAVWARVLGLPIGTVSTDQSFSSLGGTSVQWLAVFAATRRVFQNVVTGLTKGAPTSLEMGVAAGLPAEAAAQLLSARTIVDVADIVLRCAAIPLPCAASDASESIPQGPPVDGRPYLFSGGPPLHEAESLLQGQSIEIEIGRPTRPAAPAGQDVAPGAPPCHTLEFPQDVSLRVRAAVPGDRPHLLQLIASSETTAFADLSPGSLSRFEHLVDTTLPDGISVVVVATRAHAGVVGAGETIVGYALNGDAATYARTALPDSATTRNEGSAHAGYAYEMQQAVESASLGAAIRMAAPDSESSGGGYGGRMSPAPSVETATPRRGLVAYFDLLGVSASFRLAGGGVSHVSWGIPGPLRGIITVVLLRISAAVAVVRGYVAGYSIQANPATDTGALADIPTENVVSIVPAHWTAADGSRPFAGLLAGGSVRGLAHPLRRWRVRETMCEPDASAVSLARARPPISPVQTADRGSMMLVTNNNVGAYEIGDMSWDSRADHVMAHDGSLAKMASGLSSVDMAWIGEHSGQSSCDKPRHICDTVPCVQLDSYL
eukprot:TRINITY_DN496_c0_g1_i1.p1 TRINITY_DN496_c0_g1~~TRINITY_DN496_c0_g1_i1.p1  ORF type:complete len:1537 (-),score=142.42 TRINITY_DN496_c0_g1_i1:1002-5612(-)